MTNQLWKNDRKRRKQNVETSKMGSLWKITGILEMPDIPMNRQSGSKSRQLNQNIHISCGEKRSCFVTATTPL